MLDTPLKASESSVPGQCDLVDQGGFLGRLLLMKVTHQERERGIEDTHTHIYIYVYIYSFPYVSFT